MLLVVGLGNPGQKYENTRHNVGFEVVDRLATQHGFGPWKSHAGALVSRGTLGNSAVLLVKPTTFMNLSGDAVGSLMRFYKEGLESIIVIHDELDFEPGRVGVKVGGGHGGHNGLRSIMAHIGRDFARVRIGIGKPLDKDKGADYVLSRFDKRERALVDEASARAAEAVVVWATRGPQVAMNEFNKKSTASS